MFYNESGTPPNEAEPLCGVQCLYIKHEKNPETYLYDGRGSVVQLLQGGTISQSYSYNAYGYINTDEYGIQTPFYGYNGEQHDPATGLQYLRARYYAPQNGGFISQNSFAGLLTDDLSQNRYIYVWNNPVNYVDPSGNIAWPIVIKPIAEFFLYVIVPTVVVYVTGTAILDAQKGSRRSQSMTASPPTPPVVSIPVPYTGSLPNRTEIPYTPPQKYGNTTQDRKPILNSPQQYQESIPTFEELSICLLPQIYARPIQEAIGYNRNTCSYYPSFTEQNLSKELKNSILQAATAEEFEKYISGLNSNERIGPIRTRAERVARRNGWVRDERVERLNRGRIIYKDNKTEEYYSVDTLHGRFEHYNSRGEHLEEVDFDLNSKGKLDSSGKHDIRVK